MNASAFFDLRHCLRHCPFVTIIFVIFAITISLIIIIFINHQRHHFAIIVTVILILSPSWSLRNYHRHCLFAIITTILQPWLFANHHHHCRLAIIDLCQAISFNIIAQLSILHCRHFSISVIIFFFLTFKSYNHCHCAMGIKQVLSSSIFHH